MKTIMCGKDNACTSGYLENVFARICKFYALTYLLKIWMMQLYVIFTQTI